MFRGLSLSLSAVLVLAACGSPGPPDYVVMAAEIGDVRDVIPAVGSVRPERSVEVRPDLDGRVIDVLVDANAPVRRGQVLARIQPDRPSLDVEGARAEHRAAQAAAAETRARASQAQRHLSNQRKLSESGFISSAALEKATADADAAAAGVRRAEADAARAEVQVRAATGVLDSVVVRAPMDGFVLSRHVEPGQTVSRTGDNPLFVLASDSDRVLVTALVAEPDIARINRDVKVAFTVEAYRGRIFEGRVREILRAPVEERNFVSYPVVVEVDNPEGLLFPGMTASVEFIHADARQVLRAPIEALYFTPGDYTPVLPDDLVRRLNRSQDISASEKAGIYQAAEMGILFARNKRRLFIVDGGKVAMREVAIGAQSPEFVEITEGLQGGERVILGLGQTGAEPSPTG